jgi:NADH-quinone oxidoreductase subunit N
MNIPVPDFLPVLPEIILSAGALVLLMVGAYGGERSNFVVSVASIALLVLACIVVVILPHGRLTTFGGSFVLDDFARFVKVLAFGGTAAAILMSFDYVKTAGMQKFEYPILMLLAATGMGMLVSATDLIALYLGLELMSLSLYVIAAIDRDSAKSTEAGLKYFVLGGLSSGMLLYGASLIYGSTGSITFTGISL